MTITLPTREALQARVDALQRERGADLLDGRKFNDTALRAAQAELEGLDAAEAEQHRRQAAAAAKASAERQAAARASIAELERRRLGAVKEAETAARALAKALSQVRALAGELSVAARSLGIGAIGMLERREVETRLSRYLSGLLMPGQEWTYGILERAAPVFDAPPESWAEAERAATAAAINELTTKETTL